VEHLIVHSAGQVVSCCYLTQLLSQYPQNTGIAPYSYNPLHPAVSHVFRRVRKIAKRDY